MVSLPRDVHLEQDCRWEVHNYMQFKHSTTDAQVSVLVSALEGGAGKQKVNYLLKDSRISFKVVALKDPNL